MKKYYDEFMTYLNEDKTKTVEYVKDIVEHKKMNIVDVYEHILAPALNAIVGDPKSDKTFIWKEHVQSNIIQTIVESLSIYVERERQERGNKKLNEKVIIVCPSEEYHEIGARMVHDFFTIAGFDSVYIGANTPRETIESAVEIIKPKFLVISITNYYHLVETKKMIDLIKANHGDVTIIVGGQALLNTTDAFLLTNADIHLQSYKEIEELAKEGLPCS